MGQAKRKQEAARLAAAAVDLSIFQTPEVRAAVREHMCRKGTIVALPSHNELCDIDDLPDCLVGGVHQPHCRHAGKPVGPGGKP
jgi:hypothetical protein